MTGHLAHVWEVFVGELIRSHVRLKEIPDEISWAWNSEDNDHRVKLGYIDLQVHRGMNEEWWYGR